MQHANGTANMFNLIFQIPTSVVTAGGIPTSAIGCSVANFSGHNLKLVTGLPPFPNSYYLEWGNQVHSHSVHKSECYLQLETRYHRQAS